MKNLLLILMFAIGCSYANAQDNNTIKTNATCKAGQDRITTELKKLDGIFEVKFATNGTITLNYSSDGTSYNNIVEKITECGFTANGIAPKNGDKDLYKNAKQKTKISK